MKLKLITVENFRPYYGVQSIEFADSEHDHVTVVEGVNGAGKTSLFIGLNWCLYGKGHEGTGLLPCKRLLATLAEGEEARVGVSVRFAKNGDVYEFSRYLDVKKKGDSLRQGDATFTAISMGPTGDAKELKTPSLAINQLIPETARAYFFFDGEKIDQFARAGNEGEVKDAVREVIGFRALERGSDHLEKVSGRIRGSLRQAQHAELSVLLDKQNDHMSKRDECAAKIRDLSDEITRAGRQIAILDQRLQQLNEAKPLAARRVAATEELAAANQAARQAEEDLRVVCSRLGVLLATSALLDANTAIERRRAKGEIPSGIRQRLLKDLLDKRRCICGTELVVDGPHEMALKDRLGAAVSDELEDAVHSMSAEISRLGSRQSAIRKEMLRVQTEYMDQQNRQKTLQAEIDEIGLQIKSLDVEEISSLEGERGQLKRLKDDKLLSKGRIDADRQRHDAEVNKLKTEISRVEVRDRAQAVSRNAMTLAQDAAKALRDLHELAADKFRGDIETKARDIFQKLVWKNSQFRNIRLSSQYELDVLDRYGVAARTEMSAGERQLLSLSFIAAMSQTAAKDVPFVIDTPLGRISGKPRGNLAMQLPKLAEQVVLFVTDTEYDDAVRAALSSAVGRTYELQFDDSVGTTQIVETTNA